MFNWSIKGNLFSFKKAKGVMRVIKRRKNGHGINFTEAN